MSRLAVLCAALLLPAALAGGCARAATDGPRIVVGAGTSTEQRVLSALTVVALETAGIAAPVVDGLDGTVGLRREALGGDVDLFWDYTGAAWALGLSGQAPPADPRESYERVAEEDGRVNAFVWLPRSRANATLALFVRAEDRPAEADANLTWLAQELSTGQALCADPAFISRPGGLNELASAYAISVEQVTPVPADEPAAIEGVASGRCFAGLATATSGVARSAGLVPVADDLEVFPAFVVAPVVRRDALARVPGLRAALAPVIELLDTGRLAELNAQVVAGSDPRDVAEQALEGRLGAAGGEA